MLPLISLVPLLVVIAVAGETYAVVVLLNSVLLLTLTSETYDLFVWFLVYEISVVTAISAILLESRSYRRFYAFAIMTALTALTALSVYVLLNTSTWSVGMSWLTLLVLSFLFIAKIPLVPFSAWLPEAHVEASWAGSVVLAGYALKFASLGVLQFLTMILLRLDVLAAVALLSVIFGSMAMSSVSDGKKLIANFSIVHMAATVLTMILLQNSEFLLNFSWHHHSVVTSWIFALVGSVYAVSGTRLLRFLVNDSGTVPVMLLLWLTLFTLSVDMPWTANVVVEIALVRNSPHPAVLFVLCSLFWALFSFLLTTLSAKTARLVPGGDIGSGFAAFLLVSSTAVIAIGFTALLISHSYQFHPFHRSIYGRTPSFSRNQPSDLPHSPGSKPLPNGPTYFWPVQPRLSLG